MKIVVLLLLVAIVISLGSGLFFLTKKNRDSEKMLKALKVRITLSVILIVFLVGAYSFGWIAP